VLHLAQNFRSSGRIVAFANALGAALGGNDSLWTANPLGEPVRHFVALDADDEARCVSTEIRRLLQTGAVSSLTEIAVLYRVNQQREHLARILCEQGLPVQPAAAKSTVRLSTIHQTKGAEWPVVFLVGVEDGLLPHAHALERATDEEVQAERRLAYVAVTRPRLRLYLSCCRQRRHGTASRCCRPSRFFTGLPATLLDRAA
jgi:superfamily I DNA/RNA helicase